MITLLILLTLLGLILLTILGGAAILIDPLIAIGVIILMYKLVKRITTKKTK